MEGLMFAQMKELLSLSLYSTIDDTIFFIKLLPVRRLMLSIW